MLLPFVPGVGMQVNDASAWVSLGSLSLQPSEFLKLAVLLYCADLLTKRESEMHELSRTLKPTLMVAALAAGLCLLQGDLGSAIVLAGIVFAVAFVGGTPLVPMAFAGAAGGAAAVFVMSSQRRINRFTAFLDVAGNRDHLSYQTYQAMIAIAQGGTTGAGPGRGLNKLGDFLPLAHSDFIFAVVAEELGLIGVVAVVGGFLVLTYCGIQVALAASDRFGSLLAGGIIGWLVVQTVINIGGVTGLMPVTGLTLPFFSAGGSSLFVCMAAAGLLLNVARHAK
jgi:cell division protein FtsW